MHLLYCIPSLNNPGGLERILSLKVNYLIEKYNYNITIVTTEQFQKECYFELHKNICLINLDIKKDTQKLHLLTKILKYLRFNREYKEKLQSILLNNQFDICVSLGSESYFVNTIKDKSYKVLEYHFTAQRFQNLKKGNIIKIIWRKYLYLKFIKSAKNFENFVVLTKDDFLFWKKYLDNVVIINNPNTISNTIEIKGSSSNSVVSLGRLSYEKGYDRLIKIWNIVKKKYNRSWILNIYGDGTEKKKLLQLIDDLDLKDSVIIHEPRKDIVEIYTNNSIYVNTSYYEGFPLTFLEAMTYKLPIMAFESKGGINELIENEFNGYLIKNQDYNSYAQKLVELMDDKNLRIRMGNSGYILSKKYSMDYIMGDWHKLFSNIIKKSTG